MSEDTAGYPALVDDVPPLASPSGIEAAGGRFISRSRLAIRALYWVAWLTVSGRRGVSSGFVREFEALGLGALRLVASAGVLVGLIATFQVAYQLEPCSAEMMSARALGWFSLREFGPLVAGLLVVARSSSAIAGEFASMGPSNELDALRAMGLDPVKYLVAPKLAALLLALPALTILCDGAIIVGGWIGTTLFLEFGTGFYLNQLQESLNVRDLAIGMGKSVVFALVLGIIAADEGLSVDPTLRAIGGAATRAVVFCLIGVLAADTLVNAVFYFIPALV